MKINKQLIEEIEQCIDRNSNLVKSIGLGYGLLSFSLFYYYYYLLKKDDKALNQCIYYIEKSLTLLNDKYTSYHFSNEVTKLGAYLLFLRDKEVLHKDSDTLSGELNEIIETIFLQLVHTGDLDLTSGFPGVGVYFFLNSPRQFNDVLIQSLDKIDESSIINGKYRYWKFNLRDKDNPYVELGHGHGLAGVIYYLLFFYKAEIQKERVSQIIIQSINFLLSQKLNGSKMSLYPINAFVTSSYKYHGLVYGEIGLGYVLCKAGEMMQIKEYYQAGIEILLNSAKFRDDDKKFIRSAGVLYGASGLYAIYHNIYKWTGNEQFLKTKQYWQSKVLEYRNKNTNDWAGFSAFYNSENIPTQLGLGQGIAGIGIGLIVEELGITHDYLQFFNFYL